MTTLEIPPEGLPSGDGLGGTDNVAALFPNKPSAAPLPVQEDVVLLLQRLLELAQSGKLTGLVIIGFNELSDGSHALVGKCPYGTTLGIIEDMKFHLMMQNLGAQVRQQ